MKSLLMRLVLFPQSVWLVQHWWHRLATMVLLLWGLAWGVWMTGFIAHHLGDLALGEYIVFGVVFYGAMLMVGLAYRATLYVATGDKWKD